MGTAALSSLPLSLLLSVPMVDASALLSDKQYTDLSGLGARACIEKPVTPVCPWRRFFAFLDLQLLTGMV